MSIQTANKVDDLITIAQNLGFDTADQERSSTVESWEPGKLRLFHYFDHTAKKKVILFTVRAYLNGNIHIKFNQGFIARLNVEFGRLRGWINTPEQAADEIQGVDIDCAKRAFHSNQQIQVGTEFLKLT